MRDVTYGQLMEIMLAIYGPRLNWLYRQVCLGSLNDLQAAVITAGIEPSFHADPEQDIWRQMDQIRLKLVAP